jgi:hypothetical protein
MNREIYEKNKQETVKLRIKQYIEGNLLLMYDSRPPFIAQAESLDDIDFNMFPEKVFMEWD